MAQKNGIDNIYSNFWEGISAQMQKDAFCQYFLRCLQTGRNQISITQKVVERQLEGEWLHAIEETIIPLDNIIRNPRRYIKNIEEIVPIEMARNITTESVRHLAQHTNMIAKIEDDGMVIPDHILNIVKEESLDTYENRFIFSLLNNLDYFIMRRLNSMHDGGKDVTEFSFAGESMVGREKVSYRMFLSCEGTSRLSKEAYEDLLHEDTSKLTVLQRIERIRKILYDFRGSQLMKELKDCTPVRPPLHMTNVLTKNPDFVKAVELWNLISNYREDGVGSTVVENTVVPDPKFISEVTALIPLQYSIVKQHTGGELPTLPKEGAIRPTERIRAIPLEEQIETFVDSFDQDIQEIRKIFNDTFGKKEKERAAERTRIDKVITRILDVEKPWLDKEKKRLDNKKQRLAEKEAEEALMRKAMQQLLEKQEREAAEKAAAEEAARLEQERLEAEKMAQEEAAKAEAEAEKASNAVVDETDASQAGAEESAPPAEEAGEISDVAEAPAESTEALDESAEAAEEPITAESEEPSSEALTEADDRVVAESVENTEEELAVPASAEPIEEVSAEEQATEENTEENTVENTEENTVENSEAQVMAEPDFDESEVDETEFEATQKEASEEAVSKVDPVKKRFGFKKRTGIFGFGRRKK